MYRTHDCNSLRKSDISKEVALAGWVNVTRDHGGVIFIDLRDRKGLTQIVFRPEENGELAKQAHTRSEEHTSELQSQSNLVCRLLLEKKKNRMTGPSRPS